MNFSQIFLVINIGFIASILNVFHVIIGYAKTLPGQVYMATGHYYLDYFEYLQVISQGQHGHWMWENYYGTDIKFKTFLGMWQYLIIGKIGHLFNLSPITIYWVSIIIFSLILSVLIFFIIKKLLNNQPFYKQLIAYVLTLFAAPFFQITMTNGYSKISLYRFWNDSAVITNRFGGIPYHLTSQIITLLVILIVSQTLDKISSLPIKSIGLRMLIMIILLTFQVSFSPVYFLLITLALLLSLVCSIFLKKSLSQIGFLIIALLILFPIGFVFKYYFLNQFYANVAQMEAGWQIHPSLIDVFLTIGPLAIFFWLGLKGYFRHFSSIRLIFFNFVFVSYLFFFSPLSIFFSTTNTRFLTPLNYILLAVMTVVGIKKSRPLLIITICIFLFFIPANIKNISDKLNDQNLFSPITYLPKGIIDGLKFLNTIPGKKAVLTTPAQSLGMIVPIYSDKIVYLSRPGQFHYDEKINLTHQFYLRLMEEKQAKDFLNKNGIGFVVLTSIEDYPLDKISQYSFLKKIYQNQDVVIFQKK